MKTMEMSVSLTRKSTKMKSIINTNVKANVNHKTFISDICFCSGKNKNKIKKQ